LMQVPRRLCSRRDSDHRSPDSRMRRPRRPCLILPC